MDVYERRLETLAGQLAEQVLQMNPTASGSAVADADQPLMAESDSYAVALPEKLDGEGSWDVYR